MSKKQKAMKVVGISNYVSFFDQSAPDKVKYASIPLWHDRYHAAISVATMPEERFFSATILELSSDEHNEYFFYGYDEYLDCFSIITKFKLLKHDWASDDYDYSNEFSAMYDIAWSQVAAFYSTTLDKLKLTTVLESPC